MKYISTRNNGEPGVSSAQAIKQGLASDGGLFMPDEIPALEIRGFIGMTYPERAAYVMSRFLSDFTYDELLSDCVEAYGKKNFPNGATQLKTIGDKINMLELWHGPTAAFKDMALQIMPKLLSRSLSKTGENRTVYILVATSGDTGKAALEGYQDVEGVKIMAFYPADGVSHIQKLQMATQEGNNVSVCAVRGNFDDTQNGVKKIFSDVKVNEVLDKKGFFLSSANSINWGRLVPQIVYYVSAYCDMVNAGEIAFGDEIDVCVPTGNFGNIFAAYLAKQTGLPINKFICASNQNNILTDFINTGVYNRNRDFYTTMSPSMDILISSNLERLLYLISGSERTRNYMRQLNETGRYEVDGLPSDFIGAFCDEENTARTIKETFEKYCYLCDTHTAVGLYCAEKFKSERKILVVSTASPYKFASDVYKSLTGKTADDDFDALGKLYEYTKWPVPAPLADIQSKKIRFDKVIDTAEMLGEVLRNGE
ncbi:MAG: threonine synthase [Oscillospiraceae bacterium]|nr:threonine synthase [Oscillospiraceae bacterium]